MHERKEHDSSPDRQNTSFDKYIRTLRIGNEILDACDSSYENTTETEFRESFWPFRMVPNLNLAAPNVKY